MNSDKYGDVAWNIIPEGPKKGLQWSALQAWTLRSILKANTLGFVQLDYRRISEIKKALEGKCAQGAGSGERLEVECGK